MRLFTQRGKPIGRDAAGYLYTKQKLSADLQQQFWKCTHGHDCSGRGSSPVDSVDVVGSSPHNHLADPTSPEVISVKRMRSD